MREPGEIRGMRLAFLLTVIIGGAVLIAYCWLEKRVNQRACLACGYRVSVDALEDRCPRCGTLFETSGAV